MNRYPKGDAIEEYDVANPLQLKRTFVPHVLGEVAAGSIFGGAAYVHAGKDIVFTAASGGFEYDYNVYQLSAATGGDIVALTHGKGILDSFSVDGDGTIHYARGGDHHRLDPQTRAESDEDY